MSTTDNRSEETRRALLEAGVRVFSERGFDAASTRLLASQAGVNLAAIPYHFGSKKGLYLAVADHVAEEIGQRMLPDVISIAEHIEGDVDHDTLRLYLHQMLTTIAQLIIGEPRADGWAGFVLREQAQPTEAFDVLYEKVISRVIALLSALLCRLTATSDDDPINKIRATTLLGQLMIMRTSRAGVLRSMEWDTYTPERINTIVGVVLEQANLIIDNANG